MISEKRRLRTLFWEATLRCNAGCPFCGSSCGAAPSAEVDGETFCRALASLARAYDPREIMVNVTGGEPLLRKDLFDVMKRVHAMGFPWGMVTNGSLITEEKIRLMKEAGMGSVSLSVDGLYEAHDHTRRLPGAFSRIVEGIKSLAREDFLDVIQITTVVTRGNIGTLEDMLAFFSTLPVDSWRLAVVDPIGRGREQQALLLRREDLEQLAAFMDRHRFHERPVITTSCSHYLGSRDTLYRENPFRCEAGKSVASILADGSVFVCPNVPRREELIQGNIREDDIVRLWEEGFGWFRREDQRKHGPCADCPDWEACRGDSLHTWGFEENRPNFCIRDYGLWEKQDTKPDTALLGAVKEQVPGVRGLRLSYGSSSGKTVYFTPRAAAELYEYFHWGERCPDNSVEQMMAAAGILGDEQAWVERLIPVPLQDPGEMTAYFPMSQHRDVVDQIRDLPWEPPEARREPLRFLGYVHSHPGGLPAEMSLPDLTFYRRLSQLDENLVFSAVVNPQKKDLCVYWDSLFYPVTTVLLASNEDIPKWDLTNVPPAPGRTGQ